MKKMKALSIKQRLFLIMIFFVCLPSFILGWTWYETSTNTIEKSAIESNRKIIEQTSDFLDLYITNLEGSTYPFVNNPHIQRFINSRSLTPYQYFVISETVEKDLFSQMIYGRPDIMGISLTAKNGMQITDYSRVKEWIDMKPIRSRNLQLFESIDQLDNFQIIGLNHIGSIPVITVARKIHSNSTYLFQGLLIVDIELKQISNISKNVSLGGFHVWISDFKGQIIYHPESERLGTYVSADVLNGYLKKNAGAFTSDISGQNNIVIYKHSEVTDWITIAEIPLENIIANMIQLRNTSMATVAVLILFALAVIGGFSLWITRSLSFLQMLMKRVESGDFSFRLSKIKFKNHEIGNLYQSFYHMVNELNRLVQEVHLAKLKEQKMVIKQKESALQAMQSHINPHFLYNTLEIINSHAILENNMSISKMTSALAHMFRYNIGNAKQVVTLEEEITHIRSYLEIQSARYRNLHVDIQIDESLLHRVSTIRLTLQPLIENAFLHGYQNHKMKPSYIGVFGGSNDSYYLLRIIDKGGGMDCAVKEQYNSAFDSYGELHSETADAFTSIGLINVHERIRLAFGYPYGLHIACSDAQTGTTIEIKLPFTQ